MAGTPQVTVLLPVYKGGKHFRQAVESILSQTYADFEFLIVMDGSDEQTRDAVEEYRTADRRVRVVDQARRMGLGWSLHQGVLRASGQWVARMDGDDVAHPDRLRIQVHYLSAKPDVHILGTQAIDIDEDGNILGERRVPTEHAAIRRILPYANPVIHPSVMFRRSAILRVGSYNPNLRNLEDYDLWFRCMAAGLRFENLDLPLLYYRVGRDYFSKKGWEYRRTELAVRIAGCRRLRCHYWGYLGVAVPLALFAWSLIPVHLGRHAYKLARLLDPRLRTSGGRSGRQNRESRSF